MTLALAADDLSLERGGRPLLAGLSFRLAAGEALLLTGPNGVGKTSLLRAIAGFLRPAAGRVFLAEAGAEREVGQLSHWIGHANAVKPALTVAENARFWAAYLDAGRADAVAGRVGEALERFRLTELAHVPAGYLSAGQKRRLGLCRLLLAHRPVWLLDEPTVSLDAASVADLAGIVQAHLARAGLVVAATHLPLGLTGARELRLGLPA